MNMDLSRWRSFREKRENKNKARRFSGELYGSAESESRSRKSLSLGSIRSATESASKDEANVLVRLLLNTQSLLASAWGMHSGLHVPLSFVSQVPRLHKELAKAGIAVSDEKILEVLRGRYSGGDFRKALQMLITIEDSKDGVVYDIAPEFMLQSGAENNGGVTCFLDSLLFAMFANMKAFEAMIYNPADDIDEAAKKVAAHIRLFVNMSRKSMGVVTTEIIRKMQQALTDAGWPEATSGQQQDPSELFTFITDRLKLPLLTVKVDIAHGGKEMVDDDHKFINERLLNLSIPEGWGPDETVPLEDCLETYFHSRIDVRRQLERQATNEPPQSPPQSPFTYDTDEKGSGALHIETADLGSQPNSPAATPQTPVAPSIKATEESSGSSAKPGQGSVSLVRTVAVEDEFVAPSGRRKRAMTLRKEVLLPAWCFFSVLPFYTASLPEAENRSSNYAEHFSRNRPVLGLCLKRYSYHPKNGAQRDPRKVDVPLEIGLPTFVSDDEMGEDGRLYGNFKLVLQSAVCHRGNSVHSGHYIALVRGNQEGVWLRYDDLKVPERVQEIDYKTAFEEETPYLLFYQVQPLDSDEIVVGEAPPSVDLFEATSEKRLSLLSTSSENSTTTIPMIPEPTVNEPPSYDNHQTIPELGTSPPPEYTAGFLKLPGQFDTVTAGEQQAERLRPSSRSPQRPSSKDGPKTESLKKRSKSENGVGDRWENMRRSLPGRGKSQDIFSFGSRKSSEWKRDEQKRDEQNENGRPSEDSGESVISENTSVVKEDESSVKKKDKKGKVKEAEGGEKDKKGKNKEDKKEDKKEKTKDRKPKEINRECTIS